MKKLLSLLFIIFLIGCTNSNQVYWCGDHPCVNKKEREAYFKKTMIIEVKKLNAKEKKEYSEVEKVFEQSYIKKEKKGYLEEKRIAKEMRVEEKKEEKRIAKEIRVEEKERLKAEKKLTKQERIKERKKLKEEKKLLKKNKTSKKNKLKKEKNLQTLTVGSDNPNFGQIIEKITKRNLSKPYPSLNDVPN